MLSMTHSSGRVLGWLLAATLLASFGAIPPSAIAQEHPAQALVVESTNEMLRVLREEEAQIEADPQYLDAKVEEIVVPHLDFNTMTKLAVGKYWRRATASQKTDLVLEFKRLLLNTYTGALTEYKGGNISFEPFRPESREDRAVVRSSFDQAGAAGDVPVLYKLRDADGWAVYDIEVDGISLVTNYRTAFSREITRDGVDGLLGTLRERNARS